MESTGCLCSECFALTLQNVASGRCQHCYMTSICPHIVESGVFDSCPNRPSDGAPGDCGYYSDSGPSGQVPGLTVSGYGQRSASLGVNTPPRESDVSELRRARSTGCISEYEYEMCIDRCGASTVAIDNKIEQAMDLVKSHLMFAVREEVEVLKEQIKELLEKNSQLEYENSILRSSASPETLSQLSAAAPAVAPSSQGPNKASQPPPPTTS